MVSTKTVDELVTQLYGQAVADALHDVDVAESGSPESLTVDTLADKYLQPRVNKAFPQVDLTAEQFGFVFEVDKVRGAFHARGLALLLLLLTSAAIVIGVEPVQSWLKLLLAT